jgi:hypothetical protein
MRIRTRHDDNRLYSRVKLNKNNYKKKCANENCSNYLENTKQRICEECKKSHYKKELSYLN